MEQFLVSNSGQSYGNTLPPPLLLSYKPQFDMGFVKRLLGNRNRSDLSRSTEKRICQFYKPVISCLKPQVTWKAFSLQAIDSGSVRLENDVAFQSKKMGKAFAGVKQVICFVATVGSKIDHLIENLMGKGNFANAYVVDAMGSGAIEHTVSSFQKDFNRKFAINKQVTDLRFSPGYCDWPVTEQQKFFSLLDCENIGVSLSDSSLMTPRKSVSAVFGLYANDAGHQPKQINPCNRCGKYDCIARRIESPSTS
jgi:hypothetical protein